MIEKVVILVGGLGTRLRSVIGEMPKPMVDINGVPYLELLVHYLKKQGFEKIVFCVGYKGEVVKKYFGDGSQFGLRIDYSFEEELLGTAGAIKNATHLLKTEEKFFVLNGDSFIHVDFDTMKQSFLESKSVVEMAITEVEDVSRYGEVMTDSDSFVNEFCEKNSNSVRKGRINAGVYLCSKEVLQFIPDNKVCSFEKEIFPILANKKLLHAFEQCGDFIDIGTPEALEYFRKNKSLFRL